MNKRIRKILRSWIPGVISGGADNDPSGIATYSISGAQFGYGQLWLMVLSTPMLIAVQAMCARLGDVKRKGLMSIIKEHYAPIFAVSASIILIITNITTLGADLAAVSEAFGLVTNTSFMYWLLPVSLVIWYVIVFKNFKSIEKYLSFLTLIFLAYVVAGFLARPNWGEIFMSLTRPTISVSIDYFVIALALMGTTITPFLFFWQTKEEVEERKSIETLQKEAKVEDLRVAPGFIFSNIISLFIIISTATVLHGHGTYSIVSAGDAARALEPLAGSFSKVLFALGIIGSGFLAIPIIAASTAYVVAETFGWRDSLSDKLNKAKGFYTVLTASILMGMGIAISGISPLRALLYSQVLGGMLGPILLVLILFMCNDKKIMGTYVNGWFDNFFGWLAVCVMGIGTTGYFWQTIFSK